MDKINISKDLLISMINTVLYDLHYTDGEPYDRFLKKEHLWSSVLAKDIERYSPMLYSINWALNNQSSDVLEISSVPFPVSFRLKFISDIKKSLEEHRDFFYEKAGT